MATIKAYSDLQQSKKLAEILPLESADQTWAKIAIAGANLDVPEELQYRHNGDMPFQYYSGIGIPCWSLAAFLNILPDRTCVYKKTYKDGRVKYKGVAEGIKELILKDNPIDACVDMVEKLNKLNLL